MLQTDDFDNQLRVEQIPARGAVTKPEAGITPANPTEKTQAPTPPAAAAPEKILTAKEKRAAKLAAKKAKREADRLALQAKRLEAKAKRLEKTGAKSAAIEAATKAADHAEAKAESAAKVSNGALINVAAGNTPAQNSAHTDSAESMDDSIHQPSIEDPEGFAGRRPLKDPFRVGEKVTLEASYFGVVAGEMTLEVRPFVHVNGRKSYNFAGTAISTSVFAMFYAVNDWFETYVDFEKLRPFSYALHVKETKQLREARSLFNWETMKASFLDKKVNAEKQVEEKKQEWALPAFSQNIFSIAYYIRTFQLRPGKKLAIRLSHENENLVVTTEVLRREKLSTPIGEFNTIVTKPKIEINGVFKPVGDIFIWFTDDDRKFIVRMEAKIKIGTVVASVKSLDKGAE